MQINTINIQQKCSQSTLRAVYLALGKCCLLPSQVVQKICSFLHPNNRRMFYRYTYLRELGEGKARSYIIDEEGRKV